MKDLYYAPVILFAYTRLECLKKTVQALQKNVYATETDLFVFSDAARNEEYEADVRSVREYLRTIDGFKSVRIIERKKNYGLAKNIIYGVSKIVNRYGKVIVLEDDIVTSPYFLKYMDDALLFYEDIEQVMEVSAYAYPIDTSDLPQTSLIHFADCWGWGTWKRSWQYFERCPHKLRRDFSKQDRYHFNFEGAVDFWGQVEDNCNGALYTWAIFWQACIFRRNGYMVYPRDSFAHNIGIYGGGEHGKLNIDCNAEFSTGECTYFPEEIQENYMVRQRLKEYFLSTRENNLTRIKVRIKRIIRSFASSIRRYKCRYNA